MKHLNIYIITILVFVFNGTGFAQDVLPTYGMAKYTKGSLLVKWEPKTAAEWQKSKSDGYNVSISKNGIVLQQVNVKPSSYDAILKKGEGKSDFLNQFYTGAVEYLYQDKAQEKNKLGNLLDNQTPESEVEWSFILLTYAGIYDFELTTLVGLGVKLDNLPDETYTINVWVEGHPKETFKYIPNTKVPDLHMPEAEWGDKSVKIKWSTKDLKPYYYGYFLQKSEDGVKYAKSDSIPFVNTMAAGESGFDQLQFLETSDSLEFNYRDYYYRLKAMDYFGEWSNNKKVIKGQGFELLRQSPMFIYADQTEDNFAHLKWVAPDNQQHLIWKFVMTRSDSINGVYEVVVDSINKINREILIPMSKKTNYYRILAYPNKGPMIGSMPVLVMGQDNDPPIKAEILSATLNEEGHVEIIWKKNMEDDLWGYRIFKSNFMTDEFSLLNSTPKLDTVFRDSVYLKLGTEFVYYFIQVADTRNNRSPNSDTIKLTIPDVIPPSQPIINKLTQFSDSIHIAWFNSPDDDTKLQTIYRRDILNEDTWTKIFVMDSTYVDTFYYDKGLNYGSHYAYTMIATDKSNLESLPQYKREIHLVPPKEIFYPFEEVTQVVDTINGTVKLAWKCRDAEDLENVLVYKGYEKDKLNRYQYVESPSFEITDNIGKNKQVYYQLMPYYKKSKGEMKFGELIEIVLPDSESGNLQK